MPKLSVWALRIACGHLAVGLTSGALLLADKGVSFLSHTGVWFSVHFYTILFGWTVQLVVGVAYWILPTFGDRSRRGRDVLVVASLLLINAGVFVGCFGTPFGTVATVASTMQAAAAALFAWHMWPRIKAFGAG